MVKIFPEACLQAARGPRVSEYNASRHPYLNEGRDGAHLIAPVKLFQDLGPQYEMHF